MSPEKLSEKIDKLAEKVENLHLECDQYSTEFETNKAEVLVLLHDMQETCDQATAFAEMTSETPAEAEE